MVRGVNLHADVPLLYPALIIGWICVWWRQMQFHHTL